MSDTIDQGVLDYLNYALPGCPVNVNIAQVAKQTGAYKTVPLGQQCPPDYVQRDNPFGIPTFNSINTWCEAVYPSQDARMMLMNIVPVIQSCIANNQQNQQNDFQRTLDFFNLVKPGCQANTDLAAIHTRYGIIKFPYPGQPCPQGYNSNPNAFGGPFPNFPNVCMRATPSSQQEVQDLTNITPRIAACYNSTPPPLPVPPPNNLVCNYCSCPRRVDPGCPPQTMACAQGCPTDFPLPTPAPVASFGPAPTTVSPAPLTFTPAPTSVSPAPFTRTPAPITSVPPTTPAPSRANLTCNYCSCPPRVDPGCPPQNMMCTNSCQPDLQLPAPLPLGNLDDYFNRQRDALAAFTPAPTSVTPASTTFTPVPAPEPVSAPAPAPTQSISSPAPSPSESSDPTLWYILAALIIVALFSFFILRK
jgi:hypothetical protein